MIFRAQFGHRRRLGRDGRFTPEVSKPIIDGEDRVVIDERWPTQTVLESRETAIDGLECKEHIVRGARTTKVSLIAACYRREISSITLDRRTWQPTITACN